MGTTSRLVLPFPEDSDAVDVPGDVEALAESLDGAAIIDRGSLASRPTSSPGTPGIVGRLYVVSDHGNRLDLDYGTGWVSIGEIAEGAITAGGNLIAQSGDAAMTYIGDIGDGRPVVSLGLTTPFQIYRVSDNIGRTDQPMQFYGTIYVNTTLTLNGPLDHDGSTVGFYGVTPVARSATYTPTNVTTDRSFDANATSADELADVLGTLISDLKATGIIG